MERGCLDSSNDGTEIFTGSTLSLQLNDKSCVQAAFDQLNKDKFWYLKAGRKSAQGNQILSFALQYKYIHPCHTFILDLDDDNWEDVFTNFKWSDVHNYGPSNIRHIDKRMAEELDNLAEKICSKEIYNHSRAVEHHSMKEPLIGWLSTCVTSLSSLFFHEVNNIDHYMKSDRMYRLWFFLNIVFDHSRINAIGKGKSSFSSIARNAKKKISAIDEMPNSAPIPAHC
ncbi:hypothetical protein BDB01DRAFT_838166 [Pilobolus umbonatus]|nr:hypothetical protein BDB01DRAFT_838166 [Pilobolus umbonatus]